MQNLTYDPVAIEEEHSKPTKPKLEWTPFFRQMYIVTGVWIICFIMGLSFGVPTVLIAQMRREANTTEAVSLEMESWLSSVHGYSSLPFIFISAISAQRFGRKIPYIVMCISSIVSYVIFYWSKSTGHILISEIIIGALHGSNLTLMIPVVTEYTSPHYRGMLLTIKASCFFWGVWIANIVGTFSHWRNIAIIGLLLCIYSVSSIFWPESPSWLAMNGRYEEAATAHHWLKGYDAISENELRSLIKSQEEYRRTLVNRTPKSMKDRFKLIVETISMKGYLYPLMLTVGIMTLYNFSGKFVCMMYAVQLIHEITKNEETAYIGMLLLDAITIIGMCFGCFISSYLKRRTQLLGCTAIAILFLFAFSIYLYLIHIEYVTENKIASIVFLSLFSVCISCGPLIIAGPIFGEIILLQYKCSTLLILTVYSQLLMAIILKLAPSIFRTFLLHGAFLFYGFLASFFAIILYLYLPETKGKSTQEIEDIFLTQNASDRVSKDNISRNLVK